MTETFNTGETQESLRKEYNPDGSVLRLAQLRLLDMLDYLKEAAAEAGAHCVTEDSSPGTTTWI